MEQILLKLSLFTLETLLNAKKIDLSRFTFRPDASQNKLRTLVTSLTCEALALTKRRQSSAKNKREIRGPLEVTLIGSQAPCFTYS